MKQLKQYRIQIAALSETRMYDSGVKPVSNCTMIYSGASHDSKTRKAYGVAICLDQTATKVWKESGSKWKPISEGIIKIRLYCAPIHITVIAVYSPINPQTKEMDYECDKFYADLQDTVNEISSKDMLIIMGNLNAHIGKSQLSQQQSITCSIGPFTVDVTNENGTKLIDFCEMNNILLSNTFFTHKTIHQTSWIHPRSKKWHMIDYTLVNKKFRTIVEDVRMFRRAAGVIGTDHHLMRAKFRMHLKSRRKNIDVKRLKMDTSKLKDQQLIGAFQKDLSGTTEEVKDVTISIDKRYELFTTQTNEKAKSHFSIDKNIRKGKNG